MTAYEIMSIFIGINLADEIMNGLKEYADLATDDLKKSVRKAGNTVRKDIAASAPKDTGAYSK